MKKHCNFCGKPFDTSRWREKYCSDTCRTEQKREQTHRWHEEHPAPYKPKDFGYIVEKDPSPYPLIRGAQISAEEHTWMLKLKTYTPGTVVRRKDKRYEIKMKEGKFQAVRL